MIRSIVFIMLSCTCVLVSAANFNTGTKSSSCPLFTQQQCLALNIYYEARGEPDEGKNAVGWVTMNRLENYGNDICSVVYAPYQFSWTNDFDRCEANVPRDDNSLWIDALQRASIIYDSWARGVDAPFKAYFFYNPKKVQAPPWATDKTRIGSIGDHVFFKHYKKRTEVVEIDLQTLRLYRSSVVPEYIALL